MKKLLIVLFLVVSSISYSQSIPDSAVTQLKFKIEENSRKISKELENTTTFKSETKGKIDALNYVTKGDTSQFKTELSELNSYYTKAVEQEESLKKLFQGAIANLDLLNYFIETYMKNSLYLKK